MQIRFFSSIINQPSSFATQIVMDCASAGELLLFLAQQTGITCCNSQYCVCEYASDAETNQKRVLHMGQPNGLRNRVSDAARWNKQDADGTVRSSGVVSVIVSPAEALLAPLSACVVKFCSVEAVPAQSSAVCRIYSAANFPARPASSET